MTASPAAVPGDDDGGVDVVLAALADPVRRRSEELLAKALRRAGELARAAGVSPPAMSRHLRVLWRAELVTEEHPPFDARVRVYSLRAGAIGALKEWLTVAEAGWAQQLGAFREHVGRGVIGRTRPGTASRSTRSSGASPSGGRCS